MQKTIDFPHTSAIVTNLNPAQNYEMRIFAVNTLGTGRPSETLYVQTDEEAPMGKPQRIHLTTPKSQKILINWHPPLEELRNGKILGYYIGFKAVR